jgi:hypothetical protein
MKDEGGRMKGMLLNLDLLIFNSSSFILHPSAFILALPRAPSHSFREQWHQCTRAFYHRLQLRGQWRLCTAFPDPSLWLFTGALHAPA